MTVAVLVPVKDLSLAKSRLSPLLDPAERAELAALLLRGVLNAVARLDAVLAGGEPLRRLVVTAHAPSAALARELGFEVLPEDAPVSESDSVDHASRRLEEQGVRGVLRIPLDLPLIDAGDLRGLAARIVPGRQALLVPSRDGTGTNALYRSPPTLFPSRFGPGSLALHEQAARRQTGRVDIVPLVSLALDVDDPEDVAEVLRCGQPCPALDFLQARGIAQRLETALRGDIARRLVNVER
jgi:2-phospho-L-lactate guanylyltransferase